MILYLHHYLQIFAERFHRRRLLATGRLVLVGRNPEERRAEDHEPAAGAVVQFGVGGDRSLEELRGGQYQP